MNATRSPGPGVVPFVVGFVVLLGGITLILAAQNTIGRIGGSATVVAALVILVAAFNRSRRARGTGTPDQQRRRRRLMLWS